MVKSKEEQEAYHKGFLLGYQAGYRDCLRKQEQLPDFKEEVPLEALGLSTRAFHSLYFFGCRSINDVVRLKEEEIRKMRNLGSKSAAEIAAALDACGISGTPWELFR